MTNQARYFLHGSRQEVAGCYFKFVLPKKNSSIVIEKDLGVLKIHYVELIEFKTLKILRVLNFALWSSSCFISDIPPRASCWAPWHGLILWVDAVAPPSEKQCDPPLGSCLSCSMGGARKQSTTTVYSVTPLEAAIRGRTLN